MSKLDDLLTRARTFAAGWLPCPQCGAESGQANEGRGWHCSECGVARPDRTPAAVADVLRQLAEAVERLREPTCYSFDDYTWQANEDLGYIDEGQVEEVWGFHEIGRFWAARVLIPGNAERDDETELRYFATEAEARAAVENPSGATTAPADA